MVGRIIRRTTSRNHPLPILLSDAVAQLSQWTLGPPKSKNGQMSIASIVAKDGWPSVQLLPRERLGEIQTPFEPSVFRGTGDEPRKGIVFAVPPDVLADLAKIAEWAKKQAPSQIWHSVVKEPGSYSGSVKAKINMSGPNACSVVDRDGKPVKWPENWPRLPVIPIVEVRGVYIQKTGSGLILDVTCLMVGESEPDAPRECEFL